MSDNPDKSDKPNKPYDNWLERERKRKEAWQKMSTVELIEALIEAHVDDYKFRGSDVHTSRAPEIKDELQERFASFDAQYFSDKRLMDISDEKARET